MDLNYEMYASLALFLKTEMNKHIAKKVFDYFYSKLLAGQRSNVEVIIKETIQNTIVDFKKQFPEAEVFASEEFYEAFSDVINKINDLDAFDIPSSLSKKIYEGRLIVHPNDETRVQYASSFSNYFCLNLYTEFYSNKKYSSRLKAQQLIKTEKLWAENFSRMSELLAGVTHVKNAMDRTAQFSSSNIIDNTKINDLTPDEDALIAEQLETFYQQAKDHEPLVLQLKTIQQIINKIPPNNIPLQEKAFNSLLSCYLRGDAIDWQQGITMYESWKHSKSKYAVIIYAALKNNLSKFGEALQAISSISKTEIFTLSDQQKSTYYRVYALIKYNLNDSVGAKNLLNKDDEKTEDDYFNVYFYLFSQENSSEAFEKAKEVIKNPKSSVRLLRSAVAFLLDRFSFLQKKHGSGVEAFGILKSELEEAFNRALAKIKDIGETDKSSIRELTLYIPTLARLASKAKEVTSIIDKSIQNGEKDITFLYNASACYADAEEYNKAVFCYEQIDLKILIMSDWLELYVFILAKANRQDDLQLLLTKLDSLELSEERKINSKLTVVRELSKKDFYDLSQIAFENFPNEPWAILAKAESYANNAEFEKAEEIYKNNLNNHQLKMISMVYLANLYLEKMKRPDLALGYYEKLVSHEVPVREKTAYVNCLYDLKKYSDVISKVDEYDPEEIDMKLQILKGFASQNSGMLPKAKQILAKFIDLNKNDFNLNYNFAILCQKSGDLEGVTKYLTRAVEIQPNDFNSHIYLSQVHLNLKKFNEAVGHSKTALLGDFNLEMAHVNFINIYRTASNEDKSVCSDELNNLYADVFTNFMKRFPENKHIKSIEIPKDQAGNYDFKFIKDMLLEQHNAVLSSLELYMDKHLPLTMVMQGLNKSAHELWSILMANADGFGLVVGGAGEKQILADLEKIKQADSIILDSFSIFTLESMDILNLIPQLGKNIQIGSKTLSEIQNTRFRLLSTSEEHLTLGVQGKNLIKDVITKERMQSVLQFFDNILNFIKNNCETIEAIQNKPTGELSEILNEEYRELWALDFNPNAASIWSDGHLIGLGASQGKCVCTIQALFAALNGNSILSNKDYSKVVCKLTRLSYRGFIFTATQASLYISESDQLDSECFVKKIIAEPMFANEEDRIHFLAELIANLMYLKCDVSWTNTIILPYLNSSQFNEASRVHYGSMVYIEALGKAVQPATIHDYLNSLELKNSENRLIEAKEFKASIEEAITSQKLKEAELIRKRLGLTED